MKLLYIMRRMLIWYLAQKFLLPGVVKGKKNVYVWPKCHAALRFQRFHIMSEGVHSFGSRATCMGFPGGARGKEPVYQCRRRMTHRFNPCVGKIHGRGHGNPLQYSCLENPMDRGAWRATNPWGCRVRYN